MTNDQIILEKLEIIEAELMELKRARQGIEELKEDLNPLIKQSFQILLRELGEVESGFQLEDIFVLTKRMLRNMKNMAYALDQLENAIELWHTVEPLLKSAVSHGIRELGVLEQRGVFRTYAAMLEVRAKVAQHYGPEDIEAMGDSFVQMLGLLKKASNPEILTFLEKLTELPLAVKLDQAKPRGVLGLMTAMRDPELRQGLGVGIELTKALHTLQQPETK